ncbi:cytochrome P450 [Colwellia sp. E150_009]
MSDHMPDDLSIQGKDLRAFTDTLRVKHPVIKNMLGEWVLLKHADVVTAALDHERFSSKVSQHLHIPNGLDGEEHSDYRKIIERYLTPKALTPYIPVFEQTATQLMNELPLDITLDAVNDIGAVFAVRAQCKWLGWPAKLEPKLLAWMEKNHAATRSGDRSKMADVAEQFDDIIHSVIAPRRAVGNNNFDDVTSRLCQDTIYGRLLTEEEITSILRNWTGGDLGSIALCVGVIVAYVAQNPESIDYLRTATATKIDAFINEVLRLDDPFVSNKRITTCPVKIGGQNIPEGARVKLNWTSANRDEAVFDNSTFEPQKNADANLIYGIGKHVCPGRLLATWELRIALQALLASVNTITLAPNQPLEREVAPVGGYNKVPIILS